MIRSIDPLKQKPEPRRARPIAISNWLYSVAFLVFVIVVVGGITRLTECHRCFAAAQ